MPPQENATAPGGKPPRRKRVAPPRPELPAEVRKEIEDRALAVAEAMRRVKKPYLNTSWLELCIGLGLVVVTVGLLFPWMGLLTATIWAALLGFWIRGGRQAKRRLKQLGYEAGAGSQMTAREPAAPIVLTEEERALQEQLKRSAGDLNRCYRRTWLAFFGTVAGAAALAFLTIDVYPDALPVTLGCGFIVGIAALVSVTKQGDQAARETAKLLEKVGPQAAGALVNFLRSTDAQMHRPALSALTRILPLLRASDGDALDPDQRRYLYALLEPEYARKNPALAEAILAAIQQLADPAAEPFVQRLLSMPPFHTRTDRQLLQAGYLALAALHQSETDLRKRGTLLSPASAPGEDMLLHPVVAGQQPPEELLRAAGGSEEGAR